MTTFDVATNELVRAAKTMLGASKGLEAVGDTAAGLGLPSGAFGHLTNSGEVAASYTALQHHLAETTHKGAKVLDDVEGGLRAVAKCYRDEDASIASSFKGQ